MREAESASATEDIYPADLRSGDRTLSGAKSQTHECRDGKVPINPVQGGSPSALTTLRCSQVVFTQRW